MSLILSFLLLSVPGLPLAAGLLARFHAGAAAGRIAIRAATACAVLAAMAAAALAFVGPSTVRWAPLGVDSALALTLRLDAVSATMLMLITFLGTVILRFSLRYLAGDAGQARFFSWMSLALGSVLVLVLAGHLLLLWVAWIATSLCLHQLLLHYPERAGAVFSARKKFVVSRLGDASLLAAALVLHAHYRTFDLEGIFADIASGATKGLAPAGILLAVCALLKSAQFPFHSWLPDTMEAPTPVSAFMHAGIINAGGFLVVRLAPVFVAAPAASHLLAMAGAVTAAFGALVMLTQPSVKRALAYSTIAQMGFMMLQCGLGAYALALLHICAHSLYKAHAFLTSGSTVGTLPRAALPLRTSALTVGLLGGGLLVAFGVTAMHLVLTGLSAYPGVFNLGLAFAVAYLIARVCSAGGGVSVIARGMAMAATVIVLSLGLHAAADRIFHGMSSAPPSRGIVFTVGAVFAGLFLFQSLLWRAGHHPWGRRLYVHVLNGFYIGTFLNRLLGRLWPVAWSLASSSCPLSTLPAPLHRSI